jgi:hypothetical protein
MIECYATTTQLTSARLEGSAMSTAESPLATAEGPAPKSFPARFLGIFVSPRETFADIARRPDFIAPLIVLILTAIAVSEVVLAKIDMARIVRMQLEQSGRASSMSPEQAQQAIEQGARIGTIVGHFGFLFAVIGLLIAAGIGLLVVNAIFGGKANFRTVFSVTCYSNLVSVLGAVIVALVVLFGDVEHFNPQSPTPTNLGFFLSPTDTPRPLLSLASSFDIFTLWTIILLGIGLSEATARKVKTASVTLTLFGIWLLWVLIKVGLSTLRA